MAALPIAVAMDPVASVTTPAAHPADDPTAGRHVEPVLGQQFAKVLDGAQAGSFVNISHNARRGEVFTLVRREGREWHVYGSGADRKVVEVPTPAKARLAAAAEASADTSGGMPARSARAQ